MREVGTVWNTEEHRKAVGGKEEARRIMTCKMIRREMKEFQGLKARQATGGWGV